MHALENVAALAECAESNLRFIDHEPLARPELPGQAQRLEFAQAADLLRQELVGLPMRLRSDIDDSIALGIALKLAVELRPAFSIDLALEAVADLQVGPWTEFLRNEILRPATHAMTDIVPRNNEVLSVIGATAQNDVNVRIIRVPVVDPNPVELGAEVLFHLAHEVARKTPQTRHLGGIFRRDNESKMMAVVFTAFRKAHHVNIIGLWPEHVRLLAIAGDALPAEI